MSASGLITLRKFDPADADTCLSLFRSTIHRVNIRDYSPEQINAWAPLNVEVPNWASRFIGRFAYVASQNEAIVGFADMTTAGHLDRLFVSADHQRQGIARRLLERLMTDAAHQDLDRITTEASITAKLFFERVGFTVLEQQSVECRGVKLINYKMQRTL